MYIITVQFRTEELLSMSLNLLKKNHLLLLSYGKSSKQLTDEYQVRICISQLVIQQKCTYDSFKMLQK